MRWLVRMLWFALLPVLAGGCVTRAVWTNDYLEAWNEPAANPDLRLYDAAARHDFLVVYTEHSERHEKIRTRAYFLNESEQRLQARCAPCFVNPKVSVKYPAVPVYSPSFTGTNTPAAATYAMMETNGISFLLYHPDGAGTSPEEHFLPIYNDGVGKYERAALLPPAVAVDTVMIGGIVYWWAMSGSNAEFSSGR